MERRWFEFWAEWGLVARLMTAVGVAVVAGGVLQSALLVVEGASDNTARLQRDMTELLNYLAPVVADHALVGDYAAIDQILKKQVLRLEVDSLWWTDSAGRTLKAVDRSVVPTAPKWFTKIIDIEVADDTKLEVTAGGVSYGTLHGKMYPVGAENHLWQQFVKQLQIVIATLFLMLQFIWLIFRGNLSTLRELADGADRFSQGDHAVRINAQGAPEVRRAGEAFNNMATNTETLLISLGQSEAKNRLLASIVEQSSEAIWTTDIKGLVTSWNPGATALFGYAAVEMMGRERQLSQSEQAAEADRMQRLLKLEKFSYDALASTQAGTPIEIQVAVAPLLGEEGQFVGKISVARDVTERNRNDEALRAARAVAESANHAKSAFLARMSHEIRTPMNGVLGMTELLLETGLTSTQRKYAETVHRSGNNLLGIINDVLDFSKIEAGKLELEKIELDLRGTMEDVVDMLAERAHAKGLEFACSVPAGLPLQLMGDPLRLRQVLTNLAGNAIKFTESGSVLISVRSVQEAADQVTLRFDIKDTGPGISDEAQRRIFEEFAQADGSTTRHHGGSGLGLAISKQLVEMMQGRVQVESTLGKGANFWFTATFTKQSATGRVVVREVLEGLLGVRALLVEASAISGGILTAQISGWGMVHRVAETPDQALDFLKQAVSRGAPFDIVVMDLGYAADSPLALARAIKADAALAKLKLVMLTPVGNHAVIREARDAGLDACLVKPVRQSALYDALVKVMSGQSMAMEMRGRPKTETADDTAAPSQRDSLILLVEDNLVNQAVALGMLKSLMGYNVVVANNGKEAVAAWHANEVNLILMDCHMPEMDGYEATREIRKLEASSGKRVPIIALTANILAQDREECLNAGMDEHLGKPFSRRQMQDVIERWLPAASRAATVVVTNTKSLELPADVVLDRRVLGQLNELQGKDAPNLLERILTLYIEESPKDVAAATKAVAAGDLVAAGRLAHSLKSGSANIGATVMARLCAEMEIAGRAGDSDAARVLAAKLAREHERVKAAVKAELAMLASV